MTTKAETGRHFTAGHQKQPRTDLLRVHSECENSRNRTELGLRVQMTPAERIASDTWRRLGQADLLGARLGEETFTDLLVLDMLPHRSMNAFCIHHPTKPQESMIGADLLICIRYPGGSGRRLALQAKKLYPTGRYDTLEHKDTSGTRQIDKLDRFARSWGAVPAYLLYNHIDPLPLYTPYWYCCRDPDPEQLGCTLVPTWRIRQAIRARGGRTFPSIHAHEPNRPWRCVFDCDKPMQQVDDLSLLKPELQFTHRKPLFHRQTADWLQADSDGFGSLLDAHEPLSTEDLRRLLPRPVESPDVPPEDAELTYPRRVLAVDIRESESEPESELPPQPPSRTD